MVGSSQKFFLIFLITTFTFSFFSYQSSDVVIVGPTFSQEDYFIEELNTISFDFKLFFIKLTEFGKTENISIKTKLISNVLKKLRLLSSWFFLKLFVFIYLLISYN